MIWEQFCKKVKTSVLLLFFFFFCLFCKNEQMPFVSLFLIFFCFLMILLDLLLCCCSLFFKIFENLLLYPLFSFRHIYISFGWKSIVLCFNLCVCVCVCVCIFILVFVCFFAFCLFCFSTAKTQLSKKKIKTNGNKFRASNCCDCNKAFVPQTHFTTNKQKKKFYTFCLWFLQKITCFFLFYFLFFCFFWNELRFFEVLCVQPKNKKKGQNVRNR